MKSGTYMRQAFGEETQDQDNEGREINPRVLGGNSTLPDPEVLAKKKVRRRFTASYKQKILEEADKCSEGELGALLRREGLFSSNIRIWRTQRESGIISALADKKRDVKSNLDKRRIKELEREKANLIEELKKARMLIEVQKKISEIFLPATSPLPSVRV